MKLEQARKMRDGLLKGDSVMAQAWKELLDGSTGTKPLDERAEEEAQSSDRGFKTAAAFRRRDGAF